MICAIYGTTGEIIKLFPVLKRLQDGRHQFLTATTGQQVEQIPALLETLGLPQPDIWLGRGAHGRDLRTTSDVPGWLLSVAGRFLRHRGQLRTRLSRGHGQPLVLVHGDTMTTVLGACMGRLMRMPVAHIESGLRSFDLRHPFPEELNRRITSRLASIQYAPGPWAAGNLRRGAIVDTGSNTVRDSLALSQGIENLTIKVPARPFGVVSLHRFELLRDDRLFTETLEALAAESLEHPLLFVEHPVTMAAIDRLQLGRVFDSDRFARIPRLSFFQFVELMRHSSFLVTDSGGNQEETFYLDIPCLVHRKRTERQEGLGENVVLSNYDLAVLRDFLRDPGRFRRTAALPRSSPSELILSDLAARDFL